jgi:hypothetical protein
MKMTKNKIEQLIRGHVRDNHQLEPTAFPETITEIDSLSLILADSYWETRKNSEVKRDTQAGVTIHDYEAWVKSEMLELKKAELYN